MLDLLVPNKVGPQANMISTATDVLSESKKEADDKSVQKGTAVTPKITL